MNERRTADRLQEGRNGLGETEESGVMPQTSAAATDTMMPAKKDHVDHAFAVGRFSAFLIPAPVSYLHASH